MMSTNTHRRLTAGLPTDNLPMIVDAIHGDVLHSLGKAERQAQPLDTRTALAILTRQALDELASYWPAPGVEDELNEALLALRCELLASLRGDARPVEVLKHAAQTIVQLRQDIESQAALQPGGVGGQAGSQPPVRADEAE